MAKAKIRSARDYALEYRQRVERSMAKGLSRSQARGHARAGEVPIKPKSAPKSDTRLETALKHLRQSGNQSIAAKEAGVSTERFRRFVRENNLASRMGKVWQFSDARLREMIVISDGEVKHLALDGFDQASLNGSYLNAVKQFIQSNNAAFLKPFIGQSVIDAKGTAHLLETDPNTLHRLAHAESAAFHDIYRLII